MKLKEKDSIGRVAWLLPMTALGSELAIRWRQLDWFFIEPDIALLGRIFGAVVLLAALFWATIAASRFVRSEALTKWFDLSQDGRDADASWEEVFQLASLDADADPIALERNAKLRFSRRMVRRLVYLVLCLVGSGLLFAIAFDYVLFPRVPGFLQPGDKTPDVTTNLTAYLALLAAAVSIGFTYHQLRAKVRADARLVWIKDIRKLMADIIADITGLKPNWQKLHPTREAADTENAWKVGAGYIDRYTRLNKNRLLLELMLNPREKDHRLLTIIVRALVVPGIKIRADGHVADEIEDESVDWELSDLKKSVLYRLATRDNCLKDKDSAVAKANWNDAVSHIVKLSHVILKREWERVRHTR